MCDYVWPCTCMYGRVLTNNKALCDCYTTHILFADAIVRSTGGPDNLGAFSSRSKTKNKLKKLSSMCLLCMISIGKSIVFDCINKPKQRFRPKGEYNLFSLKHLPFMIYMQRYNFKFLPSITTSCTQLQLSALFEINLCVLSQSAGWNFCMHTILYILISSTAQTEIWLLPLQTPPGRVYRWGWLACYRVLEKSDRKQEKMRKKNITPSDIIGGHVMWKASRF